MQFTFLAALATLVIPVLSKNILLTNDDSFIATNIRATYYALKDAGHDVLMVAPVSQRSGWGGKFDIPYTTTLQTNGEFGYVKAGSPSWGHELDDNHIWYFNGTPASSVAFGLDYVLPTYFENTTIDLVVSGPNEGTNLSPALFTLSGTMGATYNAVYRGIPAVAFSGSNSNNSFYGDFLNDDPKNPSNIYAAKVVEFVDNLFTTQGDNSRVLPVSVGINVNFPPVGDQAQNCDDPNWVLSRLTGSDAYGFKLVLNQTTGLFQTVPTKFIGLANAVNGDVTLPGENTVVNGCSSSVSVFSVDYDAPVALLNEVKPLFGDLFS
ncbi:hypothetical protein BABINDRAFT_162116 [Babjeviella inositovora NRRL Y-12698]|uniref:Survival protein SurE-like phosphatase/nucleotidase domain-containing protein n=1 Tax=Babjeviella inositovora NRRL Y-12698 TaxID=984486 RepID=A0A1E3QNM1_9ASCO|nr:uncharacterized protein BABINDRAFT_162116 [Babjeviella inositovora NRRL Y-12698]ODQ79044.1 hypothetical protein BABINDRAFT_162116 [Babjeviella inositovora NRRL Y-12698]